MNGALYAIVGPTAAGKTKVAFETARRLSGEVVSVDSRQIYRYMDVGTDKISLKDRKTVPHHLIDIADPDEEFSAADFVKRAEDAVKRIAARGRIPILAGGSPLYYRALEGNMLSDDLPKDPDVRENLEREASEKGNEAMHTLLANADPDSALRIHPNDRYRVLRALEIWKLTGKSPTEMYRERKKIGGMKIFYFGVKAPRDVLYKKIEARAAGQFKNGYPEEVEWLMSRGYSTRHPSMKGFGYRELALCLEGGMTLEEALSADIKSTKAFSRRQMTWFRQFRPILWYDFSEIDFEKIVNDMVMRISGGMAL
ncbi:MAG: tRNA (adenosine(37)-N6)-dimethylallyltransferase MiaA [Synergistaceae bacterium]|jgi:tRNA dimethylallyltransferase|nr:tRNA (adenosine(37)-N6)-dimethylallyltransferase MiaA [Synergistaceae bacterium]